METQHDGLQISVHTIDGRCHRFRRSGDGNVEDMLKYLRHTKIFAPQNLLIVADDTVSSFASHAVSRLDVIASKPLEWAGPKNWWDTREITAEEYANQRAEMVRTMRKDRALLRLNSVVTILLTCDLTGGYRLYLESRTTHDEEHPHPEFLTSDLGSILQHPLPAAIAINRPDGGLTFINTVNMLYSTSFPSPLDVSPNMLMHDGKEVEISAPAQ